MAVPPNGYTDRQWNLTTRLRPHRKEFWLYYPAARDGGSHTLKVCDRGGYDFAVLHWDTCRTCRLGLIAKIRVTPEWHRQGYGTRMMLRALRGNETNTWTTTPQSSDAQRFFPVLTSTTGIAFPPRFATCEHMRTASNRYDSSTPRLERRPAIRSPKRADQAD